MKERDGLLACPARNVAMVLLSWQWVVSAFGNVAHRLFHRSSFIAFLLHLLFFSFSKLDLDHLRDFWNILTGKKGLPVYKQRRIGGKPVKRVVWVDEEMWRLMVHTSKNDSRKDVSGLFLLDISAIWRGCETQVEKRMVSVTTATTTERLLVSRRSTFVSIFLNNTKLTFDQPHGSSTVTSTSTCSTPGVQAFVSHQRRRTSQDGQARRGEGVPQEPRAELLHELSWVGENSRPRLHLLTGCSQFFMGDGCTHVHHSLFIANQLAPHSIATTNMKSWQ